MALDPVLRSLDLSLPACPRAVLRLSQLMSREDVHAQELAAIVETDMALAAAVMRAVNSAMFGILRRVETVAEAVLFLGLRDVAALTCEAGLRATFPDTPAMRHLWDQARLRSLLMGRCGDGLGLHAWRAQSAGLFAQVGQAALMAHDPRRHDAVRNATAAQSPGQPAATLAAAERAAFGVDHAVLGSALCRAWGLAAPVSDFVRDRPLPTSAWQTRPQDVKALLMLGAAVDARILAPEAQGGPCDDAEEAWAGMPGARLAEEVGRQFTRLAAQAEAAAVAA